MNQKATLRNLNKALHRLSNSYPRRFNVRLAATKHFVDRVFDRTDTHHFDLTLRVLEAVNDNICLVIYYLHLDTALPNRGEIKFDDYVIRGNVIDGCYVMQTIFRPGID
jgi:hypothetical protein